MKIDNKLWNTWGQNALSPFRKEPFNKGLSATAGGPQKNDRMVLSQQVLNLIENTARLQQLEQAKREAESSSEGDMLDALNESMEILKTCHLIASRIMAGDKVPLKDLKYLMEHDIQGYQLAMSMRKQKAKPKEWKSAIPEEQQTQQQVSGEAAQTSATSISEAASSGSSGSSGSSSGGSASSPQS